MGLSLMRWSATLICWRYWNFTINASSLSTAAVCVTSMGFKCCAVNKKTENWVGVDWLGDSFEWHSAELQVTVTMAVWRRRLLKCRFISVSSSWGREPRCLCLMLTHWRVSVYFRGVLRRCLCCVLYCSLKTAAAHLYAWSLYCCAIFQQSEVVNKTKSFICQ